MSEWTKAKSLHGSFGSWIKIKALSLIVEKVQFSKGEGKYGQRFNRFRGEGRQLLVIYFWCLAAQSLIASYLFLNWRNWWRAGIHVCVPVCTLMLQLAQSTIARMSSYCFRSSRCPTLNSQVQACAFKARDCVAVPKAKHFNFRDVAAQDVVDFLFQLEGNETSSTIFKCREGCSFCSSFFLFRYPRTAHHGFGCVRSCG